MYLFIRIYLLFICFTFDNLFCLFVSFVHAAWEDCVQDRSWLRACFALEFEWDLLYSCLVISLCLFLILLFVWVIEFIEHVHVQFVLFTYAFLYVLMYVSLFYFLMCIVYFHNSSFVYLCFSFLFWREVFLCKHY